VTANFNTPVTYQGAPFTIALGNLGEYGNNGCVYSVSLAGSIKLNVLDSQFGLLGWFTGSVHYSYSLVSANPDLNYGPCMAAGGYDPLLGTGANLIGTYASLFADSGEQGDLGDYSFTGTQVGNALIGSLTFTGLDPLSNGYQLFSLPVGSTYVI